MPGRPSPRRKADRSGGGTKRESGVPVSRVTVRLDFEGGRQLGHGKIRLLEMIEAHGSISSAARQMKMSYRKAWLLMDEVNRMFEQPVMETQLGGRGGGNATLTPFGRELVALYREIEQSAGQAFDSQMRGLERRLSPTPAEPQPDADAEDSRGG